MKAATSSAASPLGRNLRFARDAVEPPLSQEALARAIGVSNRALIAWEQGDAHPKWPNLVALGRVLDREPGWFYTAHEEIPA